MGTWLMRAVLLLGLVIMVSCDEQLPSQTSQSGSISVTSTPPGARIFLDHSDTGRVTPYIIPDVSAGSHSIRLTLAGHSDWEQRNVPVSAGQITTVHAPLQRTNQPPEPPSERGLGLKPMDVQAYQSAHVIRADPVSLPSSVDLSVDAPVPGDQGLQGSCVGWAVAYVVKTYQERIERGWPLTDNRHVMSPAYIYNQIKVPGGGAYFVDAFVLLIDQGVSSWAQMPYDPLDDRTQPSNRARVEAANYKIADWGAVQRTTHAVFVREIKRHLVAGDPVVIGIPMYPDFEYLNESNPVYDDDAGASRGYHAVVIVGYDDRRSAFRVANSWGTGWGIGGYGWIDYDASESLIRSAYVTKDVVASPTNERPEAASDPSPGAAATAVAVNTVLRWTRNARTTSFDVYLGTDANLRANDFQGSVAQARFAPHLAPGSQYYWRVDARGAGGITQGPVWTFTTAGTLEEPGKAVNPSPADGATGVAQNTELSWDSGGRTTSYDVYLGIAPVLGASELQTQATRTYSPSGLQAGTRYYWRIDAKNGQGTTMGDVWSFTTAQEPEPPPSGDCYDEFWWSEISISDAHLCLKLGLAEIHTKRRLGSTVLHFAAAGNRDHAVVQALIDAGAPIDATDNLDETPLFWAVGGNIWNWGSSNERNFPGGNPNVDITKTLITAGADVRHRSVTSDGFGGRTPLHHAANHNSNPRILRLLLEAGADVNAKTDLGSVPLHAAAGNPNPDIALTLLRAGGDPNVQYKGLKYAPLHVAAEDGSTGSVVDVLISWGANPNLKSRNGYVPLVLAIRSENPHDQVALALIAGGTDLDSRDNWTNSVLHQAASMEDVNPVVVGALIRAGADVNSTTKFGITPLHYAAGNNRQSDAIKLLVAAGASVTVRDTRGHTALHHAASNNPAEAATIALLNAGSPVNARAHDGATPLALALQYNQNPAIARILIEAGATTEGTLEEPGKAVNPSPADGATGVAQNTELRWDSGGRATSYDVYLGTGPVLGASERQQTQATRMYSPRGLHAGTRYYWRIDAKNGQGTTAGDVWTFTTAQTQEQDTAPVLSSIGNKTYTIGTPANETLPAATGGNGSLVYSLTPSIPGLTFDAGTRTLYGAPRQAGTYHMRYRATDEDGDADSQSFTIAVVAAPEPESLPQDFGVLLSIKDALTGDGDPTLNWSADTPLASWTGVSVSSGRVVALDLSVSFDGNDRRPNRDLSGTIPGALGNLSQLRSLDLSYNTLSGTIPAELGRLSRLEALSLSSNDLSGTIPSELGNLSQLQYLYLNHNDLSGEIPSALGNLSRLEWLEIYGNDLSGETPGALGSLTQLRTLDLGGNDLSGTIPARLGNLSRLRYLDLSNNDLSGTIPGELGNLSQLQSLHLYQNSLRGCIPATLSRFQGGGGSDINPQQGGRNLPLCTSEERNTFRSSRRSATT